MNHEKNFYLTTPIYYVNDVPHIGHAYTSIACDCLARFKRLDDYRVYFLTGTDEHGQKVEKSALARSKTPQEFCDEISDKFRELANFLEISYDDFIRTTEDRHKKTVQIFWEKLQKNGWIYKDVYEGWYAVRDEAFYAEDELVDGKAPSGAPVEWHKEESYFFRLSEFGEILLKIYEKFPDAIQPLSRRNEVISFLKGGLKDLSISRTSFKWGISVPGDEKHIIYVWLDALVNYLSALDYPDSGKYKQFWENENLAISGNWETKNTIAIADPKKIHVVGKDILRFHAVYWPAFLLAAEYKNIAEIAKLVAAAENRDLASAQKLFALLPQQIFAHGWWTNEGQKISKSLGNVIDPHKEIEWIQSFGATKEIAVDYFRYFLMREVPFGEDGNYAREQLQNRINAELANNIGNLAQRSLSMIWKNCDEKIPAQQMDYQEKSNFSLANISQIVRTIREENIPAKDFSKALANIILIGSKANEEFHHQAPWNLKKEGKIAEMNSVLYQAAETLRIIAILLQAFMPYSAGRILDLLNIPNSHRSLSALENNLAADHKISEPQIIFPQLKL